MEFKYKPGYTLLNKASGIQMKVVGHTEVAFNGWYNLKNKETGDIGSYSSEIVENQKYYEFLYDVEPNDR